MGRPDRRPSRWKKPARGRGAPGRRVGRTPSAAGEGDAGEGRGAGPRPPPRLRNLRFPRHPQSRQAPIRLKRRAGSSPPTLSLSRLASRSRRELAVAAGPAGVGAPATRRLPRGRSVGPGPSQRPNHRRWRGPRRSRPRGRPRELRRRRLPGKFPRRGAPGAAGVEEAEDGRRLPRQRTRARFSWRSRRCPVPRIRRHLRGSSRLPKGWHSSRPRRKSPGGAGSPDLAARRSPRRVRHPPRRRPREPGVPGHRFGVAGSRSYPSGGRRTSSC